MNFSAKPQRHNSLTNIEVTHKCVARINDLQFLLSDSNDWRYSPSYYTGLRNRFRNLSKIFYRTFLWQQLMAFVQKTPSSMFHRILNMHMDITWNVFSSLNFVRPKENSVFAVHDINGVKVLTRLRLDFNHLAEKKFRHNFNDFMNPMSFCGKKPVKALYYFWRCDFYSVYRLKLLNDNCALHQSLKNFSEENLLKMLLYGAEDFSSQMSSEIFKMHNKIY